MENVWAYLRANKLCNLVWDTYEDIVEACRDAWIFLTSGNCSPPLFDVDRCGMH